MQKKETTNPKARRRSTTVQDVVSILYRCPVHGSRPQTEAHRNRCPRCGRLLPGIDPDPLEDRSRLISKWATNFSAFNFYCLGLVRPIAPHKSFAAFFSSRVFEL
jgi:hypothetical protein